MLYKKSICSLLLIMLCMGFAYTATAIAATLGADSFNSLPVVVKNSSDSIDPLDSVKVNINIPGFVSYVSVIPSGPVSLQPGTSQKFMIDFHIMKHVKARSKGNIHIVVNPTTPSSSPDVWEADTPIGIETNAPKITISVLKEYEDKTGSYVKARLFKVSVNEPTYNGVYSGLDYVVLDGTTYSCAGALNWTKEILLETTRALFVKAYDLAGNIADGSDANPDPYFIQAPRWEDISPLAIPFEDYAVSPSVSLGIKDSALIDYTLPKPAQVSVRVYNSSGNLIKIIKDADEAIGAHSFTWDGANSDSEIVPDGSYYYVVDGIDYLSDTLVFEKHGLIIVDNTLPQVTIENSTLDTPEWGSLTLTADIIEPNLDEIKAYYKLHSGETCSSIIPQKIGLIDGKWNMELDTTAWPDGVYDVQVEALDFAGNTASSVTEVSIQRATAIDVKVYDIKTGMDYQEASPRVYMDYFLSRQANVKIEIFTPDMSFVKELVNAAQSSGENSAYWDGSTALTAGGTDSNSAPVTGGSYKYKITSSDDSTLSIIGDITLQKVKAHISCPWQNSLVRAYVPVEGIANGSEFKSYKLEYGEGKDPAAWTTIIRSTTPVSGGVLGYWDTGYEFEAYCSPVPYPYEKLSGEYTLRLTVTDTGDNEYETRVNVIAGRVISNELGGEGISVDDKVHLIVEPLTLEGSFEVVSIMPVELSEIAPIDKILIGEVYELQPPMLGFSEPAALTMSYTAEDIGMQDESKLGTYIWDVLKKRWKSLDTTKDLVNNILTTHIREIPRYHAYIAILADNRAPDAPGIFEPASPVYRQSARVHGITEPQNKAELFNNGSSNGTFEADYDYGYFSVYLKDLALGNNTLTAKSADPAGNTSVLSAPRTIIVYLNEPISVSTIGLKTPDFLSDYTGASVKAGDTLYIELNGADSNPDSIDIAKVKLATSISNTAGITISLTETGPNTGVYRGIAYLGIRNMVRSGSPQDETDRTICAVNNEELIISVEQDANVKITIDVENTELIDAPSIYSTSHPSVCQNTFEDNTGGWANRSGSTLLATSGANGAELTRDNTTSQTGVYSLKITNEHAGGDFSCYAVTTPYNVEDYPVISFDYKITPDVKTNFKIRVGGAYKNLIFADDPETDGSAIKTIGKVEIVKDGQWHHAEVNLYELLKKDDPQAASFTIDEIIMGDWDMSYWYSTVPGNSNPQGAAYWIDNFIVTKYITDDAPIEITWSPNQSYETGYSYIIDHAPDTVPDRVSEGAGTLRQNTARQATFRRLTTGRGISISHRAMPAAISRLRIII